MLSDMHIIYETLFAFFLVRTYVTITFSIFNSHIYFCINSTWSSLSTKRGEDRFIGKPSFALRVSSETYRNGNYVCCGKMPAESSGHVQWRDNVVALPSSFFDFFFLPLTCSRSSPFVFSFKSRMFVFPARIQSVRSKRKERVHKDHAAQIEAAG